MNENQRAFLDELAELFDKYSIDKMTCASYDNTPINFVSNDQVLCLNGYEDGRFYEIRTAAGDYEPRREGVNDDR